MVNVLAPSSKVSINLSKINFSTNFRDNEAAVSEVCLLFLRMCHECNVNV